MRWWNCTSDLDLVTVKWFLSVVVSMRTLKRLFLYTQNVSLKGCSNKQTVSRSSDWIWWTRRVDKIVFQLSSWHFNCFLEVYKDKKTPSSSHFFSLKVFIWPFVALETTGNGSRSTGRTGTSDWTKWATRTPFLLDFSYFSWKCVLFLSIFFMENVFTGWLRHIFYWIVMLFHFVLLTK